MFCAPAMWPSANDAALRTSTTIGGLGLFKRVFNSSAVILCTSGCASVTSGKVGLTVVDAVVAVFTDVVVRLVMGLVVEVDRLIDVVVIEVEVCVVDNDVV
jgi:hypothetical protein